MSTEDHQRVVSDTGVALAAVAPDLVALEAAGRTDLLAGEAQLTEYAGGAVRRGSLAGLVGRCPRDGVNALFEQ